VEAGFKPMMAIAPVVERTPDVPGILRLQGVG
jgi:hypothetical protein